MNFDQFLEGPDGEASSKRLAGISSAFIMLVLSLAGGIVFLVRNDSKSFLDLLDTISLFATGTLGLGVFDNLFKKRYDKSNANNTGS